MAFIYLFIPPNFIPSNFRKGGGRSQVPFPSQEKHGRGRGYNLYYKA